MIHLSGWSRSLFYRHATSHQAAQLFALVEEVGRPWEVRFAGAGGLGDWCQIAWLGQRLMVLSFGSKM